ncbi:WD40 repeat-like protein [Aspergillus niger CBS 101883]|uniref:WD40 repeat-like protein n=1 Tax=Aspergillus lacticoffeatus (strain CBS 101883) TaxID=1450533 RepID=UPI000D802F20|nr:WD40 repeat-like protein [Aspergillus niger CBS 101883]KAI2981556.1 hypothetical protein CBS147344_9397 [Aspergillus niger]KAI3043622.1 hypothetical protein CBS147352_8471 [Aspergillus niger]PYH56771.1 WD40 repeat-like protein [Aspergillus niger CBS 101883]
MEPSKYTGFRARFRQKLEGFRGGKPIKQNNQVGGYSTKNDSTSSARHDSSETPARDENEHAYAVKTSEEDEHVSSTEAIQQESPQKNGQAFDPSNQNVTLTEWSTTIHNALWNEAYNNLKQDLKKAKYVEAYEKLVLAVFLETPMSDAAGEGSGSRTDLGEERMKAVVAKGLERIEDSKKVMETVDNVSGVLTQVKAFLDIPLKNAPQTALPWAVISSTFDILVKPAKAAADLYNGVAYVVSRMSWYSKAVDKLLSEQNIKDNTSLEEMNHDLKTGIVDLYQSMLFYQIKSVCFYYKSQLLVLLRGFLDLDDWSGNLDAVKNAENALQNDLILYNQEHIKDQIRQITINSEQQEELDEYRNCLQSLRWIDPRAEIGDIQARNENIIEELYTWILLTDEYRQFRKWDHSTPARLWISGQAGTGKTMLLIGIIKDLIARGLSDTERPLVLYFFCQATNDQANNGVAVLRSLIWLLLLEQPQLVSHIQKEYFHSANRLLTDKNAFTTLRDIFRKMLEDKSLKRATIIIDAMDECEETSRELLTSFIDDASSAQELFNIKWLVSSRPLPEIPPSVQDVTLPTHSLLKLDEHDMSDSINRYIDIKMVQLRQKARKKGRVEEIADKLKARASNTYIWVSLVCRELLHAHEFMWTEIVDKIPKRLEDLYGYLLNRLANLDSEIMSSCCKNVLNAAMLARDPLSLSEIEILAELPEGEDAAEAVVQECRSFLTIRNGTVYLIHQSAQDYLQKHYQRLYNVPQATLHHRIYQRALNGLRKALKENIYGLPHYGITTEEVQIPNPDPLVSVRYACRYWVYHLEQSGSTSTDMEDILSFFNTHFLHWLEAMSLLGRFPDIVRLVGQLKSNPKTKSEPTLSDVLMDAERFILHSLPVAIRAPLQLYVSCLIFSPETSRVRCMFKKEACKWIRQISGTDKEWGALLQTLGHSEMVCCAAFSPDGKLVASGSSDQTVKIWDTATGSLQKILDHPATVYTVAFSSDNKLLASGSGDRFIRIWDTDAWRETERLEYSQYTTHLAFSSDSRVLASASSDDDVKLWEKGTGSVTWERRNTQPTSQLKPMALSPDTQLLAAATDPPNSSDVVTLIDTKTGSIVRRLSHANNVAKVAFSPDNRLVACALMDNTLTLWDTATWDIKRTVHYRYPNAPTFSPDGKLLTLNARDGTVQLWNTNTETVEQTLLKSQRNTGVVFSPNGQLMALMSPFRAVRLWEVIPGRREESEGYHFSSVMGVVLSPDGLLAATYSLDYTIKLWILENGNLAQTLKGHKAFVNVAAFSPNSKLLASWAYDNTVRIWNTENGEQKWKFDGGGIIIEVMNFFAENRLWAAASSDDEGRVWNTETGHLEQVDSHDHESHMPKVHRGNSSIQCKGAECDISVEKEWVIVNRKKSIWLPPEYQLFSMAKDSSWAVRENTLVIGCDSGRVLFIWFDPVAMRDVIC